MSPRPIKICIVSVHAYPVVNPQAEGTFGGVETRSWCYAKEIARLPLTEVTYVVTHRSAPRHSIVDGVNVIEATDCFEWIHQDLSNARIMWRKKQQIPWGRLPALVLKLLAWTVMRPFHNAYHRRWLIPSRRLTDINADIYVAFGVNSQSDWTLISAHSIHRPFVCFLASKSDIDPQFQRQPEFVNLFGVPSKVANHLMEESDAIVVQNSFQRDQLKQVWNRESVQISNPLELSKWDEDRRHSLPNEVPREPFVLWVGRADRSPKRPLEMLKAIQANRHIQFVMVLNPGDPDVENEIQQAALPNLILIAKVTFEQMSSLMSSASVFAITSSDAIEGQPNVLIQAAASRVPVISLECGADWLEISGAGVCVKGDSEAFARQIARFHYESDSVEIRRYSESGRSYVEREHDSVRQSEKLLNYLREIVGRSIIESHFDSPERKQSLK